MPIAEPDASASAAGNDPARPATSTPGFAGYSWMQLSLGAAGIATLLWGAWLTREVDHLKHRRIVAVGLSAMVNDFVMTEARSGNAPDQVQRDTAAFMGLLQKAMRARAASGETILVGEAVVGGSVPDVTAEVRASIGKMIIAAGGSDGRPR